MSNQVWNITVLQPIESTSLCMSSVTRNHWTCPNYPGSVRKTSELDRYLSVPLVEVPINENDFVILGWWKQIGSPIYIVVSCLAEILSLFKFQM